jgi:hypothetical protein
VISLRRRANGEGVHGCFGPVVVPRAADVGIGTDGTILRIELSKAYAESQRNFYTDRVKRGISTSGESADVFNLIPEYNTPRRFKTLADDLSGLAIGEDRQDSRCEFCETIQRRLDGLAFHVFTQRDSSPGTFFLRLYSRGLGARVTWLARSANEGRVGQPSLETEAAHQNCWAKVHRR